MPFFATLSYKMKSRKPSGTFAQANYLHNNGMMKKLLARWFVCNWIGHKWRYMYRSLEGDDWWQCTRCDVETWHCVPESMRGKSEDQWRYDRLDNGS